MAITPAGGTSAADIYSSLNTSQTKATSEIDASQNRFLRLLTTQLKMQDPLNPMDNAQVTSQLAQISTVDGISKLNSTLEKLTESSSDAQHLQAAALVGHAVLVEGSKLELLNGQSMGGVELTAPADRVAITIKDASGLVVRELDLGPKEAGISQFPWDGLTDAGTPVAKDGKYSFTVEAVLGKQKLVGTPLELAVVNSVERTGGTTRLNVGQQSLVTMNDIKQIY
ncbi:MAG: flagellar hook assembly protein FlgD [Methyloversatilis sp.]|jgi:flagellar basal-body rod modification protein FlgD|nr:flagellar hook assembly protein FlgD [Methyloversatilis sp.]MBP6194178.1 flagellar hook assembly protein FlgD [Methyloversatilis sp.]MBP9117398.1 flagellar hook assembly protein FlgD [Methyloversatilis sp.]